MMNFDDFKKKHATDEEEAKLFLEYELYMREHNPTIKEAWDQYQTLLQLMFDKNNPDFAEHRKNKREDEHRIRIEIMQEMMKVKGS